MTETPCQDQRPVIVSRCFLEAMVREFIVQKTRPGVVEFSYLPDTEHPDLDVFSATIKHVPVEHHVEA